MNKLVLENYLLVLKSTVEVYIHGTLESSNPDTKSLLNDSLNTIINSQKDTYNKMTELNIYKINNVNNNAIKNTLSKLNSQN